MRSYWILVLVIIALLVIGGWIFWGTEKVSLDNQREETQIEWSRECETRGGIANQYDECLGIDAQNCAALGGRFEECGSPCRHDVNAEICIMSCEAYCDFG